MELLQVKKHQGNRVVSIAEPPLEQEISVVSTDKPFIQANTEDCSFEEIRDNHIIPVFIKDNEPLISHSEFIETAMQVASEVYFGETILSPSIRVSNPIKGRVPDAKNKPANELEDWEKTLYWERMAFIIEVPTIHDSIGEDTLSLTIGGIKAYNLDNLYSKKGQDEHFKIFVGFKNKVCCNLKIWSDGYMGDLKVSSIGQLAACIRSLLEQHNAVYQLNCLKKLNDFSLTESQFAHIIGRARLYNNLPPTLKNEIPPLLFGDNQIGAICKDYYKDKSFCRDSEGNINLWKLYNLFTGVNKSSYVDTFIDKSVNAYNFMEKLRWAIEEKSDNWFLN